MGMRPSSGDGCNDDGVQMVSDLLGPTTYTVVHSVYNDLANIDAVAGDLTNINYVAANMAAIQDASASIATIEADKETCLAAVTTANAAATNANTSATNAHTSEVNAAQSASAAAASATQAQTIAGGNYEPAIAAGTAAQFWRGDKTWQALTKVTVGLTNVDNTADINKSVLSATKLVTARTINGIAFDGTANITINAVDSVARIASSLMGVANGVATLDSGGRVPAAQLPSYVDDVLEFANYASLPGTGETGKIYVTDDTNFEYRWSGTQYIRLVSSPGTTDALVEGTTNLYYTDVRVRAAPLTGLAPANGAAPVATDSMLTAMNRNIYQIWTAIPATYMPKTGGIFSGSISITGNVTTTTGSIYGANAGGAITNYVNAASGAVRGWGFMTAGAYAADISLQADNATIKHNAPTAHRFDVNGAQKFIVNTNGVTVSGTMLSSLFSVSGAGGAYYYQPRDGNANQPFTYSPTGNDFRVYCGSDVLQVVAGQVNVTGNLYSSSEIWTNAKIIRFGGAGSLQFIFYDGTKFEINGAVTLNGFDFSCANITASGNITSSSDRRLKKHIAYQMNFGLKDVLKLRPVTYRWKGQPNNKPKDIGFIAQDVEEIFPELVHTNEQGMKSVDYQKTTVVLLQALKELAARVEKLENGSK